MEVVGIPYQQYSADEKYVIFEPGVESNQFRLDGPVLDNASIRVLALSSTEPGRFIVKASLPGAIGVTLAPVGSSPNANAATMTGQVLNLEPANVSNPGVVTTLAQTLAGTKFFPSGIQLNTVQFVGDTNILPFYETVYPSVPPQTWTGPFAAPFGPIGWGYERIGSGKRVDMNGVETPAGGVAGIITSVVPLPVFMRPTQDRLTYIMVINANAVARGTMVIRAATGLIEIGVGFITQPAVWTGANDFPNGGGNNGFLTWQMSYV